MDAVRTSRDLKIDLLFNYASLAVLAVGGLGMNLIVVRWVGEAALGVFNQAYAIYIACSQLAVGGVHISVLRSVAQVAEGRERASVVASGVCLASVLGLAVGALVVISRRLVGSALGSPGVGDSLVFVGPALMLFALNKTLLAALNGLSSMRWFAVLQALRYVALIATLAALAIRRRPAAELAAAFLVAELAVAPLAWPCLLARVRFGPRAVTREWLWRHAHFGARGLLSGVFIELNTRVDVLVIGLFWADADVGRYSLAAVFAEGLYQCLVVVRNQMNPVLARLWLGAERARIVGLVHGAWKYLYPGMALTYLLVLALLYGLLTFAVHVPEPGQSLQCYAILGLGVLAVSGFVPFDGILLQAGKPGSYTLFTFSLAATNAALNLLLVPWLSIRGAALGTAIALAASIIYLNLILRRQLGFSYLSSAQS